MFILIALRALRLELPVWVALSGLTAAASWLLLLPCALTHSPGNPVIWDYVTALRSIQIRLDR
ncbi:MULTISPECIES: hypothetical protein [Paraburkholderia]|uniref:hypothetical protein n=1 Tax=Paraburkholderia TaxID=1822464 RepID=UPI000684169F|nr:hypothetical protein [Paraburkholderia hospita]OUL93305.1 hypothetical protein CA601_10400 [Paraburkholderia hospita]